MRETTLVEWEVFVITIKIFEVTCFKRYRRIFFVILFSNFIRSQKRLLNVFFFRSLSVSKQISDQKLCFFTTFFLIDNIRFEYVSVSGCFKFNLSSVVRCHHGLMDHWLEKIPNGFRDLAGFRDLSGTSTRSLLNLINTFRQIYCTDLRDTPPLNHISF